MSPTASRAAIAITGIVALAVIASLGIFYRQAGFKMTMGEGERSIVLDFQGNSVNVAEVLDKMLDTDGTDASSRELTEALLANRGYYHVTDPRLINALRDLPADEESAKPFRRLLYELKGPFDKPYTFAGADDERLLDALKELDPKTTSGNPLMVNPLVSGLWQMSLNVDAIFRPRPINAALEPLQGVAPGSARACVSSLLDQKQITIVSGGIMKTAFVRADRLCSAAATQRPRAARRQVRARSSWRRKTWRTFRARCGLTPMSATVEVEVMVSPKYLGQLTPASMIPDQ